MVKKMRMRPTKLKRVIVTGRETPEDENLSIVLYTPAFESVLEKHPRWSTSILAL